MLGRRVRPNADTVAETAAMALAGAPAEAGVTGHACDVAEEAQVVRFRDELLRAHDGVLVNTSSVNGFWASLGPGIPNTAYSTAKFAVRGFTEALIEDLRSNAPQVRVVLVMPGHVGTDIMANTRRVHGLPGPGDLGQAELDVARAKLDGAGLLAEGASDDELRQLITRLENDFKDKAPVTAAQAATIILDGVWSGTWRILVGQDAAWLDRLVRARPEAAYDYQELFNEAAAEHTSSVQAAGEAAT
jgi:hypothetical protein